LEPDVELNGANVEQVVVSAHPGVVSSADTEHVITTSHEHPSNHVDDNNISSPSDVGLAVAAAGTQETQ
jgi:hypothetical protein